MSHPQHESLKIGLLCLIIILLTVFVYQNTQNNKLIQTALFPRVITNITGTDADMGVTPKQIPNLPGAGNEDLAVYNTSTNTVVNADGSVCPSICVNQLTGAKITLTNGMACPAPYPVGMTYNATTKKCVKTSTR